MRVLWLMGWTLLSLLLTGPGALRADDYSGTYTIQGNKGAITLTLRKDEEGNATGTLKGGDLFLQLKGLPQEGGGLVGAATDQTGKFASFFVVSKAGDKLLFDLVQANADGDPDFEKKTSIPFPLAGATKAPGGPAEPGAGGATEPTTPEGNDPDDEDTPTTTPPTESVPAAPGAPPPAVSFAGVFKSPELTVESRAAGNDYSGTLKMAGQAFPFTATAVDGTMHGTFTSGNDRFDFRATLQGSKLTLVTDDAEYALQKQGSPAAQNPLAKPKSANPLAKPSPAKSNPAKPGPAATGVKPPAKSATSPKGATPPKSNDNAMPIGGPGQSAAWKIFQHPVGLSVRYPPTWKLTELPEGKGQRLEPPDVAMIDGGPTELYFVLGAGAEGITSVEDPRLAQTVETQVTQLFPAMRRVGETEALSAGSQPGIVMTWEGQSGAYSMRAQVLTTILKGFAVSIVGLGVKDKVVKRDKTVREIFASFAAGAGQKDPQVVGTWKFWSYKSSADGKYGTETTRLFRLMPDGNCAWSNKGESSGVFSGKDSGGNTTWTGGIAGQNSDVDQGTWSAGNGQLYVMWKDGSTSTWDYKLGGAPGNRRLFLQGSGKKPDEWVEVR